MEGQTGQHINLEVICIIIGVYLRHCGGKEEGELPQESQGRLYRRGNIELVKRQQEIHYYFYLKR